MPGHLRSAIELLDLVVERHLELTAFHRCACAGFLHRLRKADPIPCTRAVEDRRCRPRTSIDLLYEHRGGIDWRVGKVLRRAAIAVRNNRSVNRRRVIPGVAAGHCSAQWIEHEPRTGDELPIRVKGCVRHFIDLFSLLLVLLIRQVHCAICSVRR